MHLGNVAAVVLNNSAIGAALPEGPTNEVAPEEVRSRLATALNSTEKPLEQLSPDELNKFANSIGASGNVSLHVDEDARGKIYLLRDTETKQFVIQFSVPNNVERGNIAAADLNNIQYMQNDSLLTSVNVTQGTAVPPSKDLEQEALKLIQRNENILRVFNDQDSNGNYVISDTAAEEVKNDFHSTLGIPKSEDISIGTEVNGETLRTIVFSTDKNETLLDTTLRHGKSYFDKFEQHIAPEEGLKFGEMTVEQRVASVLNEKLGRFGIGQDLSSEELDNFKNTLIEVLGLKGKIDFDMKENRGQRTITLTPEGGEPTVINQRWEAETVSFGSLP